MGQATAVNHRPSIAGLDMEWEEKTECSTDMCYKLAARGATPEAFEKHVELKRVCVVQATAGCHSVPCYHNRALLLVRLQ